MGALQSLSDMYCFVLQGTVSKLFSIIFLIIQHENCVSQRQASESHLKHGARNR